jgi:hypothetical protein
MSSRDDDNTGLAAVGACFSIAGLFVFAIFAFLAVILTVFAICAWHKPLTILSLTMTPEEARRFIGRGVACAIILPVFVLFCEWFFSFQIKESLWFYVFAAGYTFGSVCMEMIEADERDRQKKAEALRPRSIPPQRTAQPRGLPRPQMEPFHFARWDDEERRR